MLSLFPDIAFDFFFGAAITDSGNIIALAPHFASPEKTLDLRILLVDAIVCP